jgi:hypothetical protein
MKKNRTLTFVMLLSAASHVLCTEDSSCKLTQWMRGKPGTRPNKYEIYEKANAAVRNFRARAACSKFVGRGALLAGVLGGGYFIYKGTCRVTQSKSQDIANG